MHNLLFIYAAVVLTFATVSLIAMHRAVVALRKSDPAIYRAAQAEMSPVPVEAGPPHDPSIWQIYAWLRRRHRHADLRGHRVLRAWLATHDLAVSGIVLMLGSLALVLMRY